MNRLLFGDNLKWLRDRKIFPDASVDLVYLDPPFNSNANYNMLFKEATGEASQAQFHAFTDTWEWTADAQKRYLANSLGLFGNESYVNGGLSEPLHSDQRRVAIRQGSRTLHQPSPLRGGNLADMSKAERIFQLAQEGADSYCMFNARRNGAGTPFIDEVINHLKFLVIKEFGTGVANQFLSKENRQSVDFWLEDEQTIMEMEFNILSSPLVLEREIFKALLAKEAGEDVRHLILIGDPGSALLSHAPTPESVINRVERQHQIRVQIWELKERGDRDREGTPLANKSEIPSDEFARR